MAAFTYFCTALVKEDGSYERHDIDIPQERIDAEEEHGPSRMGSTFSRAGDPPPVIFCEEHRGWASLVPITMGPPR